MCLARFSVLLFICVFTEVHSSLYREKTSSCVASSVLYRIHYQKFAITTIIRTKGWNSIRSTYESRVSNATHNDSISMITLEMYYHSTQGCSRTRNTYDPLFEGVFIWKRLKIVQELLNNTLMLIIAFIIYQKKELGNNT